MPISAKFTLSTKGILIFETFQKSNHRGHSNIPTVENIRMLKNADFGKIQRIAKNTDFSKINMLKCRRADTFGIINNRNFAKINNEHEGNFTRVGELPEFGKLEKEKKKCVHAHTGKKPCGNIAMKKPTGKRKPTQRKIVKNGDFAKIHTLKWCHDTLRRLSIMAISPKFLGLIKDR